MPFPNMDQSSSSVLLKLKYMFQRVICTSVKEHEFRLQSGPHISWDRRNPTNGSFIRPPPTNVPSRGGNRVARRLRTFALTMHDKCRTNTRAPRSDVTVWNNPMRRSRNRWSPRIRAFPYKNSTVCSSSVFTGRGTGYPELRPYAMGRHPS